MFGLLLKFHENSEITFAENETNRQTRVKHYPR